MSLPSTLRCRKDNSWLPLLCCQMWELVWKITFVSLWSYTGTGHLVLPLVFLGCATQSSLTPEKP